VAYDQRPASPVTDKPGHRAARGRAEAAPECCAGNSPCQAQQQPDGGGLACPVRPQVADYLTLGNLWSTPARAAAEP
jgi:hypothetical protein